MTFDARARARDRPAVSDERLSQGFAFFENAGGSQAPAFVADAIHEHVLHGFAQLGAGYPQSARADAMADAAHAVAKAMAGVVPERLGGTGGDVAIGSSTTQLLANLARSFDALVGPGDEIVVQRASHEANVAPWVRLAKRTGCTLVWWRDADATADGDETRILERLTRGAERQNENRRRLSRKQLVRRRLGRPRRRRAREEARVAVVRGGAGLGGVRAAPGAARQRLGR